MFARSRESFRALFVSIPSNVCLNCLPDLPFNPRRDSAAERMLFGYVYVGRSSDFRCGFVCPQSFAALHHRRLPQSRDSAVAKPFVRNFVDAIPRGRRYTCRICTFSSGLGVPASSSGALSSGFFSRQRDPRKVS